MLLETFPANGGAHPVASTEDGRYAFVQNDLLGLERMKDASITVIDLKEEKVLKSINTFKDRGLDPNPIVLLPEWNDPAGHSFARLGLNRVGRPGPCSGA